MFLLLFFPAFSCEEQEKDAFHICSQTFVLLWVSQAKHEIPNIYVQEKPQLHRSSKHLLDREINNVVYIKQ
jgi:hypothetical protein